ncbi:MAG: hypothetical protein IJ142_00080 [Bacteroidaceae bacterium]|nr:hypothetical protein [Bacteroidaceae bacterium]
MMSNKQNYIQNILQRKKNFPNTMYSSIQYMPIRTHPYMLLRIHHSHMKSSW